MSQVHHFSATVVRATANCWPHVELRIDGVSLLDLVRDAERPHATQEGVPLLAGNYTWPLLTPRLVRLLAGARPGASRVQGVLLNCGCGWASCWPLSLRVRLVDRLVVWQDLQHGKRAGRWNYEDLDPLRFSRAAYLDEIATLRNELTQLPEASDTPAALRDEKFAESCAI